MMYRALSRRAEKPAAYWWLLVLSTIMMFCSAWVVMVMVGNLHGWHVAIPTMGYGTAISIALPTALVNYMYGAFKMAIL